MAKNSLPSVDSGTAVQTVKAEVAVVATKDVEIVEGYLPRRVDVKLPLKHRRILRDKLRQLQDTGARLEDGTEVSDRTKAVLWILENEVAVDT
jgi:hypothetical protein